MTNKHKKFTTTPFVKQHIIKQIESGGGKVYNHFEEIPKNKYNQCKLIAPHPCITAKYVQCLAVDIHVSKTKIILHSKKKVFNNFYFFVSRLFHMNGSSKVVRKVQFLHTKILFYHLVGQF